MTKLWIANSTKQNHDFVFRQKISDGGMKDGILRPMYGDLRRYPIPVGGQVCIADDLSEEDIKNILDQHKHILNFKELNAVRGFQGLCYRVGENAVPMDKIMERIDANDDVLTQEAKDRQADTALLIARNMRAVSNTDDAPFKDLRETDVQVAQKGAKDGSNPEVNEVVEVTEEGKQPSGRGRRSAS